MRSVRIALVAGLALTAAAVLVVLSRSPALVARTNFPAEHKIGATAGSASACQSGELLPAGTTALRLGLAAALGPSVRVAVVSGEQVVTSGERGEGWAGGAVTVHVRPLPRAVKDASVCFAFRGEHERVTLLGERTPASDAATSGEQALPGRMRIEYLRPGRSSWWSLVAIVAKHMGFGRAWGGAWIALLVLALSTATATLALWTGVRELR